MKKIFFIVLAVTTSITVFTQNPATIQENIVSMKTYPFFDPNPIPNPDNLFYPYFRFDGFTDHKINKKWKTVELENEYIRLSLFPEIGGKVWGAIDKTTGKEFIYYNHVVKFRDIAMPYFLNPRRLLHKTKRRRKCKLLHIGCGLYHKDNLDGGSQFTSRQSLFYNPHNMA